MKRLILYLNALMVFIPAAIGQHLSPSYRDAEPYWLEQLIYNGKEWRPRMIPVSGHEFFLTSGYVDASVTIDGIIFTNLRVKYDIFSDELILLSKDNHAIVLSGRDIDGFTLFGDGGGLPEYGYQTRSFINLRDTYPGLKGFAEVIYRGRSMVVARHTKVIARHTSVSSYAQYRDNTRYWFITDTLCMPLKNRKSFFGMLGDYGDEVRQYIRQNHIAMGAFSPEGFGMAAEYYDSLLNSREEAE